MASDLKHSQRSLGAALRGRDAALPALVVVASLLFYLVCAAHFAQQPLRIEEQEWPPMAAAIVEHGKPVVHADETHKLRFNEDLSVDMSDSVGAWHPPLYQYVMAAAMVVVGTDASYTLRLIGVAGLLLACTLLALIAREAVPNRWRWVAAAGVGLVLVHPYASQGSTFLDIDTSLYAPAALLVLWLTLRWTREPRISLPKLLLIAAAVALAAWLKLTTTVPLVAVLVVWWVLARRGRGLAEVAVVVAGGTALFLGTYALWCAATEIPFRYTFDYTFGRKSDRLGATLLIGQAFEWHLYWLHPAFLLLAIGYGLDALWSFARTRRPRPMDLLWGFGAAVVLLYVFVSPTNSVYQGKYAFPGFVALALPIAWRAVTLGAAAGWRSLAVAGALGTVAALLLPDLVLSSTYLLRESGYGWQIVGACAAALLLAWRLPPRSWGPAPAALVLVACAALLVGQSIRGYEADTSPMYPNADTRDFEEAVANVKRITDEHDYVFVPKDMGFYLQDRRVVEGEDAFHRGDERAARMLRKMTRIRVVARNTFGPPVAPETQKAIDECFKNVTTIGSAAVHLRTPC